MTDLIKRLRHGPIEVKQMSLRNEAADELEHLRNRLKEIADLSGRTLLGCADEDCDLYPHCDEREHHAHERGANKAFEQCAAIAKEALENV